jgi:outer membrane receptor protein involved in Fe transport
VFTPNPTTVISVRYGFNRFPNLTIYESAGFDPAKLGFPGNFVQQLQFLQFPSITMQTVTNLGTGGPSASVYHSKNALASVSKFMGRHSLKAGFDYRLLHIDFINYGPAGAFTFSDQFTRKNPNTGSDGTGSDVASLLLGIPASGSATQATKFFQFIRYYAGYVQDDFRLSSKLTLNMGLRYEYETGPQDANDHFLVGFDPNAVSPLGAPAKGGVMYAGVNGNKSACCNPSSKKFAPRVGVAYAMNDKTTIRGGVTASSSRRFRSAD